MTTQTQAGNMIQSYQDLRFGKLKNSWLTFRFQTLTFWPCTITFATTDKCLRAPAGNGGAQTFVFMEVTMAKSIYIYPENRERLALLVGELGLKPNTLINRLIENASIGEVTRREPVVTLAKKNSAHGVLTTTSAESVRN
jgi:hypothetical protein